MASPQEDLNNLLANILQSAQSISLDDFVKPETRQDVGDFVGRMGADISSISPSDFVSPQVKHDLGAFVTNMLASAAPVGNAVPSANASPQPKQAVNPNPKGYPGQGRTGEADPQYASADAAPDAPTVGQTMPLGDRTPESDAILRMMQQAGMEGANYNPDGKKMLDTPASATEKKGSGNAGADRVNADTGQTGIRAIVDENGKVTLTNLDDSGGRIQKSGSVIPTTGQRMVENNVQNLLDQMRKTTDGATGRALLDQFNNAKVAEETRLYNDAQAQASAKLGLPDMQAQLDAAIAADRADPLYRPGMGDSPITAKIRQAIDTGKGYADAEAKRYLQGNVSFNALQNTAKSMEQESLRLTKLDDAKTRRAESQDNRIANREDQQADAEYRLRLSKQLSSEEHQRQEQEKLQQKAMSLTNQQKDAIRVLFPEKADATDTELAATIDKIPKNSPTRAVVDAADGELPLLATTGNLKAAAVIQAKEKDLGVDPAVTKDRLRELNKIFNDPNLVKEGLDKSMKGGTKEQKQNALNTLLQGETLGTPQEKQAAMMQKYNFALAKLNQGIAATYRNHLEQWKVADPSFQLALSKARETTGSTDMANVLAAYVGNASGQERRIKVDNFKLLASGAAKETQDSLLGSIDPVTLGNDIEHLAIKTVAQRISESVGNYLDAVDRRSYTGVPGTIMGTFRGLQESGMRLVDNALKSKD
jgi:hypothetical protein